MLNIPNHHIKTVIVTMLALAGLWQYGQGVYIYAKAQLAQVLLHRAWEQTLQSHQTHKPWPWADTWPVARLQMQKQHVDLIVLAGDSGRTLAFGPGYQFGSAMPGQSGNTIISAHRDTHFSFLIHVSIGDSFRLQTNHNTFMDYQVETIAVIDSRTDKIRIDAEGHRITLVTCYPFDAISTGGPLRYVVILKEKISSDTRRIV